MNISIIGSGYVGLVSGTCFAEFGVHVTCVDTDAQKIEALKKGILPIYEPGLEDMMMQNSAAGRLTFTTDITEGLDQADAIFIAVGTPSRRGDGDADMTYVFEAGRSIAQALTRDAIVITKSTVPVGTGQALKKLFQELRPDLTISVASNPEFLREGAAIEDFMRPNRVVTGTDTDAAKEVLRRLYRPLFLNKTPMVETTLETAELIKYAANGFLATKIAFINEIANLCEACGADVQEVAQGIGLDQRIGAKFLHPGPGYGGSCFPKDTLALARTAEHYECSLSIISAVIQANIQRKDSMGPRVHDIMGGHLKGATIGILGLTFKPNTDDMRDSPSLELIPYLIKEGAHVRVYDPKGMAEAKKLLGDYPLTWCTSSQEVAQKADALVLLTEWNEFRSLNMPELAEIMAFPRLIDLRNVYTPQEIGDLGFDYYSVGRGPVLGASSPFLLHPKAL